MRTTPTLQKNNVVVQYAVPRRGVPRASALRAWARAVAAFPLTLRIVGASEGRRLNREYRKKNYATNVLSFHSGDIVLCHPVIVREARAQKKSVRAHYAHLVVHGVLHLRGHAHDDKASARRMEARETRALARFGFADPYTVK
ncbi:MAG: rRNA maturation RNase YbeY [Betaproteobacteria bacterium]|nr:rRNA maturation RNase YbeY [Betaproteobacteria bacterium]MBV9360420.1 rRNA maturation RNase YbeY [Betaproteobacteria bacterium]